MKTGDSLGNCLFGSITARIRRELKDNFESNFINFCPAPTDVWLLCRLGDLIDGCSQSTR